MESQRRVRQRLLVCRARDFAQTKDKGSYSEWHCLGMARPSEIGAKGWLEVRFCILLVYWKGRGDLTYSKELSML
jgi:hypothetical protein